MECHPSCSFTSTALENNIQDKELAVLTNEQGISVWGTNQQVLEEQALVELEIFSQENHTVDNVDIEEGEIVDNNKPTVHPSLDLDQYIKRQEELRRIQEYQKTLQVPDKNKLIADKIDRIAHQRKKKCKRKSVSKEKPQTVKKSKIEKVEIVEGTSDGEINNSGSEYVPSDEELLEIDSESEMKQSRIRVKSHSETNKNAFKDDGCIESYRNRLEQYYKQLESEKCLEEDSEPEDLEYYTIKGGLKIPFKIWNNLYSYQQDGVRWMWKIHRHSPGGLLGDEMGLGKTVQVIAFLAGLDYSQAATLHDQFKGLGPTLIVCPVTVIHQWVQHFHNWAPEFRVAILHQSGSYQRDKNKLIKEINRNKGILVTSYVSVLKYKERISEFTWHYLILDEGHKIRNHNAKISVAVKNIRSQHRLMLTGSPMQNNLQELWSLFDFTNPGMLGSLNTFMEHFNNPIVQGGFVNSTPMQEATAFSVATTLKNVITPFLLRRSKNEVQHHISLPNKSEQVLFCSLSKQQKDLYKGYLMSDHIGSILRKDSKNWFVENQTRANVFIAITALRKICNHPDIYLHEAEETNEDEASVEDSFGYYKKSGKMIVVSALLKIWKKQRHRVLLFTQSRAMIKVFEQFLKQQDYKYLKMDGSTSVASRQPLINKFNEDTSYDVFLLTTRVGGLGVNLTGANRVIIYDPDWNPATDTQARERAWRIGQDKQVTIYRLLSAGTIEEKMYQRQVWKQLLSNKVLLDPKTHRFFKSSSLHDLFSLPDDVQESNPETTNIFRESRVRLQERIQEKKNRKNVGDEIQFSEDKIQAMKDLAQQIAKSLAPVVEKKTSYQIELEEERKIKLAEKQELKKLSAMELMNLNREKAKKKEDLGNKVDDCDASFSFDQALEYSEQNAKLYKELKKEKVKHVKEKISSDEKYVAFRKKRKDHDKGVFKSVVDNSGTVDGEKIDGLVKTEVKKLRKKFEKSADKSESQDDYVLEKLFSKKGISGALQHDSVVSSNVQKQSLKIQSEAKLRADKALDALRKSRLNNWRW